MTYLKNGAEFLDADERTIYDAIKALNAQGRTTNNSQIANRTGLSRTRVGDLTTGLRMRGYLKDVSTGAAYHWRTTAKVVLASDLHDKLTTAFGNALKGI
jgi:DNA-binding IclR family transcriptional regulator